jgi:hypothetical protein
MLRALRWLGWATFEDIRTALDIPGHEEDKRQYEAHYSMLRRLVGLGEVERRIACGKHEYRLAPGVSVAPPTDTAICSDTEAA